MTIEQVSTSTGLSAEQARERLLRFGENRVPDAPAESLRHKIVSQFTSPLIAILLLALLVDTGIWVYEGATRFPTEAVAILFILLANSALGLWQNLKSEKALARLSVYTEPHCWVIRDGALQKIESRLLVPQDIVRVEAGERLPADGKVLEVSGFMVDESIATGESAPVTPDLDAPLLAGTLVVMGSALFGVTATGKQSNIGQLASMLSTMELDQTPLERHLIRVGHKIAIAVTVVAVLLWFVGILLAGTSHISDLFLFAVALAVAAVPESLPVAITLTLSLGVERMAKRNAVVRKMSAVEALGSVTVIATDKTGTLTENKMTVQDVDASDPQQAERAMVLVNDADLDSGAGDPLELGILNYIHGRDSQLIDNIKASHAPVSRRPFDAQWKFMRVSVRDPAGNVVSYFKGAPEVLLQRCRLDSNEKVLWQKRMDDYAGKGFRILAMARSEGESEQELDWLGLILLVDPPRPEVEDAIHRTHAAGIRVIMITGDHPATGHEIARQVGIHAERAYTGAELAPLSDQQFGEVLRSNNVFARVSPELKLRIVKTLQQQQEVVAVTGDGINDAPALKAADVGIAMGQRGSDISREVAELVLVDDNFATIVAAIEEGRNIFENIQKFMRFLFTANFAEVSLIVFGSLVAFVMLADDAQLLLPLTAAQILWINLLTDSVPALAIAFDQNPGILQMPPRHRGAALLDRYALAFVFFVGIVSSACALFLLYYLPHLGLPPELTQTAVFLYLIVMQFALVNPARKSDLIPRRNSLVIIAIITGLLIQLLVLGIPALRILLGLVPVTAQVLAIVMGMVLVSWLLAVVCSAVLRHLQRPAQSPGAG